jgi:hypothetical protein
VSSPILDPRPGFCYSQTVARFLMWSALSDERRVCHFQLLLTPPAWRPRSPYLNPPGTGWPRYNRRHWVPFPEPSTTPRATVEVFVPASTRAFEYVASVRFDSFKLLLAFTSTIIPGFSVLEIHNQGFYSFLDMHVFRNWASSSTKQQFVFMQALRLLHRSFSTGISALSRRPGHYGLCHCAILSNTYARCTGVSCECRLVHQVMP